MSSTDEPRDEPHTKKWECGDPYQYQIPANGDHWENLLTPLIEGDKAQCDAWKDEVQNLLIFAGLFSGVLTAFVIESYQGLQSDPNDVMIALLTRIATRLDNPLNGTTLVPQQIDELPSGSPVASSIRINIFWFISLVFSLTTVLVGIISLQWLREHQEYPKSLSSKERFALFNMRARGLEAWYVPQVFAALPVLLQFALVLFFVGLVDFLLASQTKVAIPVIIAIGVPLAFLVWTTVMPSLQAFSMCLPIAGRLDQVPDQCPYKSTQSRILRHIITFSQPVFLFFTRVATALHSLVVLRPLRLVNSSMNSPPAPGDDRRYSYEFERRHLFGDMFEMWCRKKWLKFDQDWLTIRDGYAKSISDGEWWMSHDSRFYARKVGPLYDLTNGLFSIIAVNVDTTIQLSAFHCIQELTSSVIGENSEYPAFLLTQNQYLQKLLGDPRLLSEPFPTFSSILEKPSVELLKDENAFIFISQCSNPPLILLQHFAELHIRILNNIYSEQPLASTTASFPHYPENLCLYNYGKKTGNRDGVFNAQISDQFALIVDSFLKSVASHDIDNKTLLGSFNAQGSGEFLRYAVLRQSDRAIQPTLDFLTATLDQYTTADGKLDQRSDFMFYISAFYARSLMISDPWHFHFWSQGEEWDESPAVEAFLPSIRLYLQKRGTLDIALGERLGIPPPSDKWWEFLNRSVKVPDESQDDPEKIAPTENDLNPNPGVLVPKLNSSADDLV